MNEAMTIIDYLAAGDSRKCRNRAQAGLILFPAGVWCAFRILAKSIRSIKVLEKTKPTVNTITDMRNRVVSVQ